MSNRAILECVMNVSEGASRRKIDALVRAGATSLLDVHSDRHHNRSVLTLGGPDVESDARSVARAALGLIDMSNHSGVHPRIGAVDVVPFVPLPGSGADLELAITARNAFAHWMSDEFGIPCFLYGPERSLPEVRAGAFKSLMPDFGPNVAPVHSGASAVGARNFLIAYNLWLRDTPLEEARPIAQAMRSANVRTLALAVGSAVQISCNLIDPLGAGGIGPAEVFDQVAARATIDRAELVGLIPAAALSLVPKSRWGALDLGEDKTIEARLTTH